MLDRYKVHGWEKNYTRITFEMTARRWRAFLVSIVHPSGRREKGIAFRLTFEKRNETLPNWKPRPDRWRMEYVSSSCVAACVACRNNRWLTIDPSANTAEGSLHVARTSGGGWRRFCARFWPCQKRWNVATRGDKVENKRVLSSRPPSNKWESFSFERSLKSTLRTKNIRIRIEWMDLERNNLSLN